MKKRIIAMRCRDKENILSVFPFCLWGRLPNSKVTVALILSIRTSVT